MDSTATVSKEQALRCGSKTGHDKADVRGSNHYLVVGAGPAGLTAAHSLAEAGIRCRVVEATQYIGGIARTHSYKGYRFDIGGHRFYTKVESVNQLWARIMGDDFITVPRLSRIFYDNKYYNYPLKISSTLLNLGLIESCKVLGSYLRWRAFPSKEEHNLEQWVTNRFGKRLFLKFFKTYTEKVWGMPCTEIRADWAAQRIKTLTPWKVIQQSLTGLNNTTSLIEEFKYPRLGPGMMWEKFASEIKTLGGEVDLGLKVTRVRHDQYNVKSVDFLDHNNEPSSLTVDQVISSMPLSELVLTMSPPAPDLVRESAKALKYRDFLIVVLILDSPDPFSDNWIYVHSPDVTVGRIQNFKAWSEDMVPNKNTASIGMEYFCHAGDNLWEMDDKDLLALAKNELEKIGLAKAESCLDGTVIRQPKAYPVYDEDYQVHVERLRKYLTRFDNLQTIGRNGLHRYNNQDHSMVTGLMAAQKLLDPAIRSEVDVWTVNLDRSYQEEVRVAAGTELNLRS